MSSLLKPKKLLSDDDAKSRFQYKRKKRKADGSTTSKSSQGLRFKGAQMFRMRLVCATLTGKSVRIDDIRLLDENPGLNGTKYVLLCFELCLFLVSYSISCQFRTKPFIAIMITCCVPNSFNVDCTHTHYV